MALLPQFRSAQRDIDSDVARLAPILVLVRKAAREAERELNGLRPRVDDLSSRTAFLLGTGIESEADADPESRAELKELERRLVRGGNRQRYLERQLEAFLEIIKVLGAVVDTSHTGRR